MTNRQVDAGTTAPGLLDLEKELICSICTDLLYQPLTVLDCLHTFCGSCLQEWFSWQVSQPRSGRTPRFTCPSCRAPVRETRPNATVTTLLEMFLQANPNRQKLPEEREEIAKRYKPGNSVLPARGPEPSDSESDEEDRRLVEEVREMSLRDVGVGSSRQSSAGGAPSSRDRRERDRGRRQDPQSRRRDGEEPRRRTGTQRDSPSAHIQTGDRDRETSSGRQIEHQSSLRSLLSASDGESPLEEQILRQIVEEGLLDDIDLRNLDQAQEDELTERIAQAYRRRHRERSTAHQRTRSDTSERPRTSERRVRSQSAQARAADLTRQQHPPVSRPHLLETPPSAQATRHQRSASDQGSRRHRPSTSPVNRAQLSDVALPSARRSSSDTTRPRPPRSARSASAQRESRTAPIPRSSGEPGGRVPVSPRTERERPSRAADRRPPESLSLRPAATVPLQHSPSPNRTERGSTEAGDARRGLREPSSRGDRATSSRASSARANPDRTEPALFPEPSICCERCGAQDIQYELHKSCPRCNDGKYNLCLSCYRHGRGCLHWFGFGSSAHIRFEKTFPRASSGQSTPTHEPPHILKSQKYRHPPSDAVEQVVDGTGKMTNDDPANRLQSGMFCDMCLSFADGWFWKCSRCNEGEWGFCNHCVNQGKCCTHPLLPISRVVSGDGRTQPSDSTIASPLNLTPSSSHTLQPVAVIPGGYQQLTFSTKCGNCTYPIPPSTTRFHCPECNNGDYNICTNCYNKLVSSRKISQENGPNGWRRCLRGHRMIVVGFIDHEDGQRRVVVKGLVGGHALKDDKPAGSSSSAAATSSPDAGTGDWSWKDGPDGSRTKTIRARNPWESTTSLALSPTAMTFDTAAGSSTQADPPAAVQPPPIPPSGGIGLRVLALWSYYPDPKDVDELSFPRGAEITEAENINDDWFWGCYAGNKGLFPGAYGRVLGEV